MVEQKNFEINEEIKLLLDERLADYYQNPKDVMDFDKTIDDIEQSLFGA